MSVKSGFFHALCQMQSHRFFLCPCIDIFQTDLSVNLSKQPHAARCEIALQPVRQVVTLCTWERLVSSGSTLKS